MLYFSGSGIQIFSLGMIFMLLTSPISAVLNIFRGTCDPRRLPNSTPRCDNGLIHTMRLTRRSVRGIPTDSTQDGRGTFLRAVGRADDHLHRISGLSVSLASS
jgi:hypothetical protein